MGIETRDLGAGARLLGAFYRKRLANSPLFVNAAFFWSCRVASRRRFGPSCPYAPPSWRAEPRDMPLGALRVALIADEMTCRGFDGVCQTRTLSPQGWRQELEAFRPDLLFCESAWLGAAEQGGCWRWKLYRHESLRFDNRRELRDILRYCGEARVPTVFWNKEDPTYFHDRAHDFADTAGLFDHVFTTDADCVPLYLDRGCRDAAVLPFGYPPALFYPLEGAFDAGRAVFFGSWFADQPQRCRDMEALLDMALAAGLSLEIYDRQWGVGDSRRQYPEKYRPYVRPGVPYGKIRETIGRPCCAVNINTVTGSATMFARRVQEMMACGCIVISNDSPGLRRRFGDGIWFAGEPFDAGRAEELRQRNLRDVQRRDSWTARLMTVLEHTGQAEYIIGGSAGTEGLEK